MSKINKQIRQFTAIGIFATLIGYMFLIYQSYNLRDDINTKKNEVQQLESLRVEKIKELTEIQNQILEITSTSQDTNTVKKGEKLAEERGIPIVNSFKVTTKQESSLSKAEEYEKLGFQSILDKDINSSIDAFIKSENAYNGRNAVYEIARYLVKNKSKLSDKNSDYWPIVFQTILSNYSWKMPDNYKIEFKNRAE